MSSYGWKTFYIIMAGIGIFIGGALSIFNSWISTPNNHFIYGTLLVLLGLGILVVGLFRFIGIFSYSMLKDIKKVNRMIDDELDREGY